MRLGLAGAALLWASPAWAQMRAPPMPPGIVDLHDAFIETIDAAQKQRALTQLSRTPPLTQRDVQALFDLFMRFPEQSVRQAALDSLGLLDQKNVHLEPLFLRYLEEPDAEAVLFGIKGTLRLRSPVALPLIQKLAKRPFAFESPQDTPILAEKNAWWVQYEALAALAQWEKAKALPLLSKKASEAPSVARIMASWLWKDSLPLLARWTASSRGRNRRKAQEGFAAEVPVPVLREAMPEMLKILRDPKADKELRHQLAIKVGLASTPEEVGALLREYESLKDPQTRLMLSAALFASRDPQVLPLLVQHAKEHADPRIRAGALVQLKDMLPPAQHRALLEWSAQKDPDPDNRQDAARQLREPLTR